MTAPTPARRRSLTNVGGSTDTWGPKEATRALNAALEVLGAEVGGEEAARAHVHGFHTYPARLHPDTARGLVRSLAPEGGLVLDPFCGSGTVLVEAMLAGRRAAGTDLNPLATLLARVKTAIPEPGEGERIIAAARAIAETADARRKARAGATRKLAREDVAMFEPHVLLELDGVRAGVEAVREKYIKDALSVVLAAIIVKVSRKRADTASADDRRGEAPKRIAAGYVLRFFVKKTEDLCRRRDELAALLPESAKTGPRARITEDDASELRTIAAGSIDAIVTSPPYAATYDYVEHHSLRFRWLGLDGRRLERAEMGARRAYANLDVDAARDKWRAELTGFLRAAARVTKIDAPIVLVIADSAVGKYERARPLRADEAVAEAAEKLPLEPVARASQARPHFHRVTEGAFAKRPRFEHALLLRRVRR